MNPFELVQKCERGEVLAKVLEAVRDGCWTVHDVVDELGIPLHSASAHLSALCEDGLIRKTGEIKVSRVGRKTHVYNIAH